MSVLRVIAPSTASRWPRKTYQVWSQRGCKQAGQCHFSTSGRQIEGEVPCLGPRYQPEDIKFPAYEGHCARVSIINGGITQMLSSLLVHPAPSSASHKYMRLASYSFLVESHHRSQKVLFDLAFMKDLFNRMPPSLKAMLSGDVKVVDPVMKIKDIFDVPDTLLSHGYNLSEINSIIWSHPHIDHVGDPALFPSTTDLVVGPGFKTACMPGYPTNPNATVLDSAFQGRAVKQLDFDHDGSSVKNIGGFRAIDFWRDGSFWVLECPGHTGHHLGALCRTTPNSWVFMGADCCHSVTQLRPSLFRTLPQDLPASMLGQPNSLRSSPCPCAQLLRLLHSRAKSERPVYELVPFLQEDAIKAQETLEKLKAFDGRDDVMVVLAHDASFLDILDFFPHSINDWMAKGWHDQARWSFLREIPQIFMAN